MNCNQIRKLNSDCFNHLCLFSLFFPDIELNIFGFWPFFWSIIKSKKSIFLLTIYYKCSFYFGWYKWVKSHRSQLLSRLDGTAEPQGNRAGNCIEEKCFCLHNKGHILNKLASKCSNYTTDKWLLVHLQQRLGFSIQREEGAKVAQMK